MWRSGATLVSYGKCHLNGRVVLEGLVIHTAYRKQTFVRLVMNSELKLGEFSGDRNSSLGGYLGDARGGKTPVGFFGNPCEWIVAQRDTVDLLVDTERSL